MSETLRRKIREPGLSLIIESDGSVEIETSDGTIPLDGGGGGPHDHDGTYSPEGHSHAHDHDANYEALGHNHDASYSASGHSHTHNHDGTYSAEGHSHSHNHDGTYAPTHSHPYSSDTHNHDASYSASGHSHTHNHDADYAADDHTHPGGGSALDAWPVGSVYIAVDSTSPATRFGGGTWAAFGAGRVLVGIDAGQTEFDTAEETGGAKTHTLTESEMPSHTHVENLNSATTGGLRGATPDTSTNTSTATGYSTGATGGGGAHNNLQPYIVVYMWKRTA